MSFKDWCVRNRVSELPAEPEDIARFVAENYALGAEKLWPMILEISKSHRAYGLADPVQAPRSWTKDEQILFFEMPQRLRLCVLKRATEADKEATSSSGPRKTGHQR